MAFKIGDKVTYADEVIKNIKVNTNKKKVITEIREIAVIKEKILYYKDEDRLMGMDSNNYRLATKKELKKLSIKKLFINK